MLVRIVTLICVFDIALERWLVSSSASRRQLFQEIKWQHLLNFGHYALYVLFRVSVEVVRVRPTNAERWEEAVQVLQVVDRLTSQNQMGAFQLVAVMRCLKIIFLYKVQN